MIPRAALFLAAALAGPAMADPATHIAPVWSRIVAFAVPEGFAPAFETAREGSYILEFVPDGQSVQDWDQMLTLTGAEGFARDRPQAVESFAESLAQGYANACPDSFAATTLPAPQVPGAEAVFAGHLSCLDLPGAGHGEAVVVLIAASGEDVFTLQWALRDAPGGVALINGRTWADRLDALAAGFRLCPRVEGETAPYPSCSG